MPSPFPGMDPFLEHPDVFPDLHDSFIVYLGETLQRELSPRYYSAIGRRAWVEITERYIEPDVVIRVPHDERRETFLEIYVGQARDRRLVTTIELLSLTNKTPGEHGRDLYIRKQQELVYSKVHLVEIDLLRAGTHTTAVSERRLRKKVPRFDYHVCAHRFDNLEEFVVYPVRLENRLPAIQIPLLPDDPPVTVDLQAVFSRCYDAGPYAYEIQYSIDAIVPPLASEQVEWAKSVLASRPPRSGTGN